MERTHPDNVEIKSKIKSLSTNQLRDHDKIAAQNALEVGVNLYRTHHYSLAIEKLNKALIHFPNHIGIKLNLLQVLLVSFDKNKENIQDLEQAEELIEQFHEIKTDSEFYIRFTKLNHKYILIKKHLD